MGISKKKLEELEKRIADLEGKVQSQQEVSTEDIVKKITATLKEEMYQVIPR